jgi:creatinine amidohydrolase
MTRDFSAVQFELLLPYQLRAITEKRPVAYVPLGTYEWHGEHLPVGLDSLTAHGLCLRAAMIDGGVVLPPHYYGTGGGHGDYPWTIISSSPADIESQLIFTLQKLELFGFGLAVFFSGHFADRQLEMIDRVSSDWNKRGSTLRAIATAVNRIEGLAISPDHAGLFEATLLAAMKPELVQLGRLKSLAEAPIPIGEDDFGDVRHNPEHPIYGVFGADPRNLKLEHAGPLLDASVEWLVRQVRAGLEHRTAK